LVETGGLTALTVTSPPNGAFAYITVAVIQCEEHEETFISQRGCLLIMAA
jgi:hypothetical protein